MKNKIFVKNFIWNLLGTSFSSFNSLFFLIIVTWINGIEEAGIYSIGAAISIILYTIGEYSGRLFQVTDTQNKIKDKDYIVNRIITSILVLILGIIIALIRRYDFYKSGVVIALCTYKGLDAFSEVLYGILQKNDKLYKVGQSYTIKSLIGLVIFFITNKITNNLLLACISLAIVNLITILIFDICNVKKVAKFNYKVNIDNVKTIFKKEFFVFATSFAGVYILNAQKYAIDGFLNDSIQAIYSYIMMPASVINLFTKFVITPFLNNFKEYINKNDFIKLKKITNKIKIVIIFFGTICVGLAYIIGPEILSFIYGVKLDLYIVNLCVIITAYILYSISYLDLVVLTTLRKTLVQFIIYIFGIVIAFVFSNILVSKLGINGATISCLITLGFLFLSYTIITNNIYNKNNKV